MHELRASAEFPSPPSMIASFTRANLPFVLLKQTLGARFDPIERELAARAAAHFGPGPVKVELLALLSIGTR